MRDRDLPNFKRLLSVASLLCAISAQAQTDFPEFSRIQADTFGGNMALSNAWGDYDNDGDLDLIISFKTGDVRLYNNEFGQFTNVGPALGLPTKARNADLLPGVTMMQMATSTST